MPIENAGATIPFNINEDGRSRSLSHETDLEAKMYAPLLLIVFVGLLPTPTVVVTLVALKNVWLTFGGLYYVWVVGPTIICSVWPGCRQRSLAAFRRGSRNARKQLLLAVPLGIGVVVGGVLAYRFLGRWLGVRPAQIAERIVPYGLVDSALAADVSVISWLVLLNPLMEEFFWRLFLFAQLRKPHEEGACARWWAPAWGVAVMYAAYHVPVIAVCGLPAYLVALGFLFLVGFGMFMQLVVERLGIFVAIGLHTAADITACVILADVVWSLGIEARRLRQLGGV